jgi:hypothetical protein
MKCFSISRLVRCHEILFETEIPGRHRSIVLAQLPDDEFS